MSAPSSPGAAMSVRASRSAAATTSAPASWAAAATARKSRSRPEAPGYCTSTPKLSGSSPSSGCSTSVMPSGSALVASTALVWGSASASTTNTELFDLPARRASVMASAAAVASSSRDAPETGRPVRSETTVWKFSSASRRPCEISGWYGV